MRQQLPGLLNIGAEPVVALVAQPPAAAAPDPVWADDMVVVLQLHRQIVEALRDVDNPAEADHQRLAHIPPLQIADLDRVIALEALRRARLQAGKMAVEEAAFPAMGGVGLCRAFDGAFVFLPGHFGPTFWASVGRRRVGQGIRQGECLRISSRASHLAHHSSAGMTMPSRYLAISGLRKAMSSSWNDRSIASVKAG